MREYFPHIADLQEQVQLVYWSDFHFISETLLQFLGGRRFYQYANYQLGPLADKARRDLLYWALGDVWRFDRQPTDQITLSYNETFLWQYIVLPQHQEIITALWAGNRIRFLSWFHLSQTKVEVEFSKIWALSILATKFWLVCTDSKEYTWRFADWVWETNIVNQEFDLINPQTFNFPITKPNNLRREEVYQEHLRILQEIPDDFIGLVLILPK